MGNKTEKRAAMVFVFLPMQISNACAHVAIVHELPVEFSILYGVMVNEASGYGADCYGLYSC